MILEEGVNVMPDIRKYGGVWKFFNKEIPYQGELHINKDNRVIALEILLPASEENPLPRPPYKGRIPYICGTLFSGAKVLLYDCITGKEKNYLMTYTSQVIYANYAFWGLNVNSSEEIKFTKVVFDFGEIIGWSGLCKYEWEFTENGCRNLMWHHQGPVKFELNEGLEISLSPAQGKTAGGSIYEKTIEVTQHILVEFAYKNPNSWDSIIEDALCIQYLIGLGTSQEVTIYKAQYSHPLIYTEYSKHDGRLGKIYRLADVVMGTGKVEPTQNTKPFDCLFTLEDIVKGDVFNKWRENYSVLKPVLDLYFTAFSRTAGTPEMLFINLTQALETYHARFITDDANEYFVRVDDLIKSFCQNKRNAEHWKSFLLDDGQKKNNRRIFLRSRLADLIFANGLLPLYPNGYHLDDYIRKIVDTRNYYTHYNPAKRDKAFTKAELPRINGHLLALIEYHILILMGFDADETRKRTFQKVRQIDDFYQIRERTYDIERRERSRIIKKTKRQI